MLLLPGSVRILLATEPVDMRNSINGLVALVQGGWREDVYSGHFFVFVSRRRDRVKILTWDNGGFVVFYKRLEAGRFRRPALSAAGAAARLDATQLAMLLDGIDLSRVRRPTKWAPPAGDRQRPENLISTARWPTPSTSASGGSAARRSKGSSRTSGTTSRR